MSDKTQFQTNNSNPVAGGVGTQAMDRMAKSAHKGIDAASQAAHPTIDRAAAGAHRAVEGADELASHAADAIDRAGVKGEELLATSTSYMREHPLLTLGLAVTAGYVLSRILAPR
jgi:ElaB/YqjD/DUF883 family membrane-anchored ribosome-binding protein